MRKNITANFYETSTLEISCKYTATFHHLFSFNKLISELCNESKKGEQNQSENTKSKMTRSSFNAKRVSVKFN